MIRFFIVTDSEFHIHNLLKAGWISNPRRFRPSKDRTFYWDCLRNGWPPNPFREKPPTVITLQDDEWIPGTVLTPVFKRTWPTISDPQDRYSNGGFVPDPWAPWEHF